MKRIIKQTAQYTLSLGCIRWRLPAGAEAAFGLTFDDGPNPEHTPALLDTLDRHNAKATFYVIGHHLAANQDLGREIIARGHRLGNHSLRHRDFANLSVKRQISELRQTDELLRSITGENRFSFRPPRGQLPFSLLVSLGLRRHPIQLWTFDTMDYKLDAELVFSRLNRRQPQPRDVLLFHDDGPLAAQVLEEMLPVWNKAGLRAMSV